VSIGMLEAADFDDGSYDSTHATRVSVDLAAWCEVAGHRFVFEKTPLAEVIKVLGGGGLQRTGDSGAATFDYYVDFTDGKHLIRFSSNNDMGGEDHALQGVEIRALDSTDHADRLPRLKLPILFPFGSSDISLTGITRKLGRTKPHGGIFAYICTTRSRGVDSMGNKMDLESDSTLEFRVLDGKIVALSVDRVTSG
jgi:pimeloyl-ACP methyl ester carboxylesterase